MKIKIELSLINAMGEKSVTYESDVGIYSSSKKHLVQQIAEEEFKNSLKHMLGSINVPYTDNEDE